ncbi:Hypothetical protein MVR_LOCUS17 [uncultured virus]|nr:Hypothetical protein MVR_LOCUS17 [uncultured virus]
MESLRATNLELQNTITHQPNNPYRSRQDQRKPNSYCYENLVLIDTSKLSHETLKQDEKVTIAKVPQLTFLYDLHYLKAYPCLTTICFVSNFGIKYPKIATSYDEQLVFPSVVTLVIDGRRHLDLSSKLNINATFPNINHLVIDMSSFVQAIKSTLEVIGIINSIECERLSVIINNKNLNFKHNTLLRDVSEVLNQMQLANPTHKQIKTVAVFGMFTLADIAQHPLLRYSVPHSNRRSSLPHPCEEPNYKPTRAEHLILDDVHFDLAIDLQLFNIKLEAHGATQGAINYNGVKSLQLYNCQLIQDTPIQLDNIIEAKEDWDTIEMTKMRDTYNEDEYGIYLRDDEDEDEVASLPFTDAEDSDEFEST